MRDLGSLYFLNRHTFVCGTNFHIQKCNTCRELENPSRGICYCTMVQYTYYSIFWAQVLNIGTILVNKVLNLVPG